METRSSQNPRRVVLPKFLPEPFPSSRPLLFSKDRGKGGHLVSVPHEGALSVAAAYRLVIPLGWDPGEAPWETKKKWRDGK